MQLVQIDGMCIFVFVAFTTECMTNDPNGVTQRN
jgi:hypothetical protein